MQAFYMSGTPRVAQYGRAQESLMQGRTDSEGIKRALFGQTV